MKYRKRPLIVEAEQFRGFYATPWPKGVDVSNDDATRNRCFVVTIHNQRAYLDADDWVITEPDGVHHYPCKPDIFAATYEPVAEGSPCPDCKGSGRVHVDEPGNCEPLYESCGRCKGSGRIV